MRRFFFIASLLLLSSPIFAQKVRYIKLTDQRWEFMTTDESYRPKGENYFDVAFQVYNDINEPNRDFAVRFFMILTFSILDKSTEIPEGGKLLIKTGNNEVISSANETSGSILAYSPATGYREDISCHEYVPGRLVSSYKIRGKYELQADDIVKMAENGVIKLRIETNGESIDVNLPLEEQIKVGKDKISVNKFSVSIAMMSFLADSIFTPLDYF